MESFRFWGHLSRIAPALCCIIIPRRCRETMVIDSVKTLLIELFVHIMLSPDVLYTSAARTKLPDNGDFHPGRKARKSGEIRREMRISSGLVRICFRASSRLCSAARGRLLETSHNPLHKMPGEIVNSAVQHDFSRFIDLGASHSLCRTSIATLARNGCHVPLFVLSQS